MVANASRGPVIPNDACMLMYDGLSAMKLKRWWWFGHQDEDGRLCCSITALPAMQCYLFNIIGVESRPSIVMAIWSINRRLKATSGVYWWIINMDMAKNRHTEPGPTCWQHLLVVTKLLFGTPISWNWNFGKFSLKKERYSKTDKCNMKNLATGLPIHLVLHRFMLLMSVESHFHKN